MNEALAWVGQIAEWFGQFIPRWVIITTTHGGVKWVRGHKVKALGPGIHWYWPATTFLSQFPIVRQGSILEPQTICSKDGVTLAVTTVVVYEVEDLKALFTQTQDADNTISEICLTAAQDVLTAMDWRDMQGMKRSKLHTELRGRAQSVLKPYGVRVVKMILKDLAPCKVIRILGGKGDEYVPVDEP